MMSNRASTVPLDANASGSLSIAGRPTRFLVLSVAACGFAFVTVLLLGLAMHHDLDHDEHQFVASGALMASKGLLPYRDYTHHHVPNLTFVYALLFNMTDRLLLAARSFSVACAVGMLALVFYSGTRAFGSRGWAAGLAAGAAGVIVLLANPLFMYTSGHAWNHDLPILFTVAAFVVHSRGASLASPARLTFASGLLVGLAAGTRLSFAPLGLGFLLSTLLLYERPVADRMRAAVALCAGAATALIPTVALFALAPAEFLHGNLGYNLELNTAYRADMAYGTAMDASGKLAFAFSEILVRKSNALLLVAFLAATACLPWRARGGRRWPFELQLTALLLPLLLFGALSPTPSWQQYYYPLAPFLVLGLLHAMRRYDDMRARWIPGAAVAGLLAISVIFVGRYPSPAHALSIEEWRPVQLHRTGVAVANRAGGGRVLTLAPIAPLEGGAEIYEQFATGPFAWRTAAFMDETTRRRHGVVGPDELADLLRVDAPSAILLGYEDKEGENAEEALLRYARENGYTPVALAGGLELWVTP